MSDNLPLNEQQRGYLNIYIPFRVKLKRICCSKKVLKMVKPETKLMIKPVAKVANDRVANYCLYNVSPSGDELTEIENLNKDKEEPKGLSKEEKKYYQEYSSVNNDQVYIFNKKDKKTISIKDIEEKIKNRLGKTDESGTIKLVNRNNANAFIQNVEFSIYNDGKKNKLGFLKVRIRIDFLQKFETKDEVQAIRDIYDVLSRNVKRKFDKKTTDMDFGFDYQDLSNAFNKLKVVFADKNKYKLCIDEKDWLFNYEENDRRSYTFSFITINKVIEDYVNLETTISENNKEQFSSSRDDLYHLSRLHENGAIRTYNKKNDIYKFYMDDTSAIWGVSRVGMAALSVQNTRKEFYRNINVLNSDFSFLYEFALHQKFYYYLMTQHDGKMKKYIRTKEELYKYIDYFCPNVISEFETQEIYEEVRSKLEIAKLLDDAKNSLKAYEAERGRRKNTGFITISLILFGMLFPITFYEYIYQGLNTSMSIYKTEGWLSEVIGKDIPLLIMAGSTRLGRVISFIALVLIGLVIALIYYWITDKTKSN